MSKLIQPRTLKGFRDHVPASMIPRERLIDTAREVYRSFGFAPIDTPAKRPMRNSALRLPSDSMGRPPIVQTARPTTYQQQKKTIVLYRPQCTSATHAPRMGVM